MVQTRYCPFSHATRDLVDNKNMLQFEYLKKNKITRYDVT